MNPYLTVHPCSLVLATGQEAGQAYRGLFKVVDVIAIDETQMPSVKGRPLLSSGEWSKQVIDLGPAWDFPGQDLGAPGTPLMNSETGSLIRRADQLDSAQLASSERRLDSYRFGKTDIRIKQPDDVKPGEEDV